MKFVTAYAVTRHYGGPEEGGWWYDYHAPIQTIPCEPEHAEIVREHLKTKHQDIAHGDISSVLGGAALWVAVEDEACEFATRERPHYE